jgi:hypothetical protein
LFLLVCFFFHDLFFFFHLGGPPPSRPPPPPPPPPGLQALRLTADFIRIVTDYLRAIRPLCYDEAGVLPAPSLSGDAPLFVNPSTGLRLTRMSRLLQEFFEQTLGLRLHSTRLRSILFTAVATTCSSTAVQQYAAGDTHRGEGVRDWKRG